MSKKIKNIVLVILWGLVYLMPLLHFLIQLNPHVSQTVSSFFNVMTNYVSDNNFVYTSLYEIFGDTLHYFNTGSGILMYFSYFIIISFAHVCVDLLLFLPETCRYCFDKITNKKDGDNYLE